ncbi:aminopeptidase RNPEPL1 [Ambystoma mexicanum]|uniref:aminopeptidase RNPEPL1 n=1 Tax=Ambystoma mexicanum TaxID=8296 RepID=UPI0037E87207
MASVPAPGLCCCRRRSLVPPVSPGPAFSGPTLPADVASASSFHLFKLRHFHLGLELRPEARELAGVLVLELSALQASPCALVLDSHPAISVQAVRCRMGAAREQPLPRFPRPTLRARVGSAPLSVSSLVDPCSLSSGHCRSPVPTNSQSSSSATFSRNCPSPAFAVIKCPSPATSNRSCCSPAPPNMNCSSSALARHPSSAPSSSCPISENYSASDAKSCTSFATSSTSCPSSDSYSISCLSPSNVSPSCQSTAQSTVTSFVSSSLPVCTSSGIVLPSDSSTLLSPESTLRSFNSTTSTPLSAISKDCTPFSPVALGPFPSAQGGFEDLCAMSSDNPYHSLASNPILAGSDWHGATFDEPTDASSHSSSSCPLPFRVDAFTDYGSALIISVPAALQPHEHFQVIIQYTASDGPAIWWLDPELTYGKSKLFVFTQGHSVCNRSFFPCFDTPAVKSTYSATVKAPAGIQVLMSATHSTYLQDEGVYQFQMDYPVPAYLVALAAGDIVHADIGPRSRVWAEPCLLQTAISKLAGFVEPWLSAAEELYGPYIWGRYDIVFLPPSFPIVAMENPCLTFIISSILESDEFLIIDVIHEIAHSWFGNAVTNATWEEMWLSEGLATYAQRRITTETYGGSFTCLETAFRLDALHRQMKLLGDDTPVSKLQVKLEPGVNPSNLMNLFTYEKGYCFVYYLSQLCGDLQQFDAFLRAYIEKFKFTSVVAQDLLDSFLIFFPELKKQCVENLEGLEFERWLNATGPPLVEPDLSQGSNLTKPVEELSGLWTSESLDCSTAAPSVDITKWQTFQTVLFLDRLLDRSPLSHEVMMKLSQCYSCLLDSMNAEIRIRWLQIVVRNNYFPDLYKVRRFLESQMSRMYTIPLYEDLGTSTLKPFALEVFYQTQHRLHPNLRKTILQILAQGGNPAPSCSDSNVFSFSDSSTMVLGDQTPEPSAGAISLRDVNVSA